MSLPLFHTPTHTSIFLPLYVSLCSTPGETTPLLVLRHNADTLRDAATKQPADEHAANEEEYHRDEIVFRRRAEDLLSRVVQARYWHNL